MLTQGDSAGHGRMRRDISGPWVRSDPSPPRACVWGVERTSSFGPGSLELGAAERGCVGGAIRGRVCRLRLSPEEMLGGAGSTCGLTHSEVRVLGPGEAGADLEVPWEVPAARSLGRRGG